MAFPLCFQIQNVKFCWVPAHVGIQGNETADLEAKAAVVNRDIGYQKVPCTDMKPVIQSFIKTKWQEVWSSTSLNIIIIIYAFTSDFPFAGLDV